MQEFEYKITDEIGMHARPAGLFVKEAGKFKSKITIHRDEKSADATRLLSVMGLGIKQNDTVRLTIEGEDEEAAKDALEAFFKKNL